MNRREWIQLKSQQMLECLPQKTRDVLRGYDLAPEFSDLFPATVIAFICLRYKFAKSIDEITDEINRTEIFNGVQPSVICNDIVIPICNFFRKRQLPFSDWWDAESIFHLFLSYYIHARIDSSGIESAISECQKLWGMRDLNRITELCDLAGQKLPSDIWERLKAHKSPKIKDIIVDFVDSTETEKTVNRILTQYPPEIHICDDFLNAARFVLTLKLLCDMAEKTVGNSEYAASIVDHTNEVGKYFDSGYEGLSLIETSILLPPSSDEEILRKILNTRKNSFELDAIGVNSVPETINGKHLIPMWLIDYVFGSGGRHYHCSAGPISHFSVVFETTDEIPSDKLCLLPFKKEGDRLEIEIVTNDPINGVACIPFSFDLNSAIHLYDLVLMCVTKVIRIDYFYISEKGSLEYFKSGQFPLPNEWLVGLRKLVIDLIRDKYSNDPKCFARQLVIDRGSDDPKMGILMSEKAKSEQLLLILNEKKLTEKYHSEVVKELTKARKEFLGIKLRQADDVFQGNMDSYEKTQGTAAIRRNQVVHLQEKTRFIVKTESVTLDIIPELERLADALESEERCLLHLTFRDGYYDALWLKRINGKVQTGRIDISNIDHSEVMAKVNSWLGASTDLEYKRAALKEILSMLGDTLSHSIVDPLHEIGVRQLVISPTGYLDALPLHLITFNNGFLLDEFESITYAPSGGVLVKLLERESLAHNSICSIGYAGANGDIPQTECEAEWISRLFGNSKLLTGVEATSERVLDACSNASIVHIASHGLWFGDWYCSGLELHESEISSGYLSVAKILASSTDLNTRLVTLSSCCSGRTFVPTFRIQDYAAIDGAFLAKGAQSTVAALWEVEDDAAFMFMKAFYLSLRQGSTVEAAVKRAMQFLRNREYKLDILPDEWESEFSANDPDWRKRVQKSSIDYGDPFYWGAFRCSGLTWKSPCG
ncbi:CHAT domain-containing protein [Gimesia maris]|uniref:CHAT domain-containing protein n=1 Tax=Gimesia maris TaxID=122 RepID=UPI00241EC789|nr:CHAT domain-containing protein [Gimesia maris]